MLEIGDTLREARMRQRIDISEVEAATKIRAKYLRALENEEWELLPGPAYVKSFLRTYADYVGLDSRLLVEQYRQRYERPSTHELTAFGPGLGGHRRASRTPVALGPGIVLILGVVALLGALYFLGTRGSSNDEGTPPSRAGAPTPSATPKSKGRHAHRHRPKRVSLRLIATQTVYVCLEDARGRPVVDGATLTPGQSTRTYRSKRFRANFGNGAIRMRVNGHTYSAAASSDPIGYEMRPGKRPRRLPESIRVRLCA